MTDLQWRPETYWGEGRAADAGAPTPERRAEMLELGKQHPSLLGGGFLPGGEEGEVEIARIELRSVTADIISVRARPDDDRIAYRVVGSAASPTASASGPTSTTSRPRPGNSSTSCG